MISNVVGYLKYVAFINVTWMNGNRMVYDVLKSIPDFKDEDFFLFDRFAICHFVSSLHLILMKGMTGSKGFGFDENVKNVLIYKDDICPKDVSPYRSRNKMSELFPH
ncbi:hypothetical protein TNCV_2502451 [Trichonephila clavipes]|nr:hypothetical protein TNCV_2502451 [Trichonephila clavipes]